MKWKHYIVYLSVITILPASTRSQQPHSYAREMGEQVMNWWKDSLTSGHRPAKWSYDQSVVLQGMVELWYATGDGRYFRYIQHAMDHFVDDTGAIRTYRYQDFTLDNIAPGRDLLLLYNVTGEKKYLDAVTTLRRQLSRQPRTEEGGFWHKKIYPGQMWLDGLYMAEPFYTEFAQAFHEDSDYHDIARQFVLMERHARDPMTGLLYHAYDATRSQQWADPATGRSRNFWGRAMGWYGMALVDVLQDFPDSISGKKVLVAILQRYARAVRRYQDPASGVWWDVLNAPGRRGNFREASASCMFVYALAKGVRLGYLPASYLAAAMRGYRGILRQFIKRSRGGALDLYGTVGVSGLGGHPYRDGSYAYYTGEKVVVNDPKGIGSFLLAAAEIEKLPTWQLGRGKTVLLDNYFNHETKKDLTGMTVTWHYVWNEQDNGGYSMFAHIFHRYGVRTETLYTAPTGQRLENAGIYIIVDPDTRAENEHPAYISGQDVESICDWVRAGGILLLFGNDSGNVEFAHFNRLAARFGITFNEDSRNRETGRNFEMAAVPVPPHTPVFDDINKVYIKEYASVRVQPPAETLLRQNGFGVIAVAKYGKGTVFAVGDPWFYNEYEDGRKIPMSFQNYQAASDLVRWVVTGARLKNEP